MEFTPEEQSQFTELIDDILQKSDLKTITPKEIRRQLSERLGRDISAHRDALKPLIAERFDKINSSTAAEDSPKTNGHSKPPSTSTNGVKRESHDADHSDSEAPKKKRKQHGDSSADADAKLAARLQAEENSRARPSRAGVTKKAAVAKKRSPKKKTPAKVKADDDSDLEVDSSGEVKSVERKGGFHKQYALSEPLVALVGETKLSRPQVVKHVWGHIKALGLQDPADKRQILCDDKMFAVFKTDKVHMFTMNKILGKHLYEVEEAEPPVAAE